MDPYSAEGELVNIHTAFHQAQYGTVVDFDTSSFSPSNTLPARVLKLRAQIALGNYDEAISEVQGEESTPDLAAVKAFAEYSKDPWDSEETVQAVEQLVQQEPDNLNVQLLCGSVLANAGRKDEALALLSRHQGSLDAVALIVQIYLQQNRTDLAAREAKSARGFAQDSLLVNLAESWVGLREGGEKYQQAFYVFEELAQAPASTSPTSLIAQAVAELHLGRLPESEVALQQALEKQPEHPDAIANSIVLNTILGNETEELRARLGTVAAKHEFLVGVQARREAFAAACERYNPKFEP
ncbi:coatomer epsilon subunit-domain-containing protein [Cryomyces antarcticus]